jgi:hypothetical protein
MSEGPDKVKEAVRRAKQSGIFMVFVIVDNPESKVITFRILLVVTADNGCIAGSFYSCTSVLKRRVTGSAGSCSPSLCDQHMEGSNCA